MWCSKMDQPTNCWLLHVYDWLKRGTGKRVCLLGGSRLGDLFLKRLGQTTLQELSACPELHIILGVFRAITAALIKDGNHCRYLPGSFLLAQWGHFGACDRENTTLLEVISKKWERLNSYLKWERPPWTVFVSLPTDAAFPRTSFRLRKDFWGLIFSNAVWGAAAWSSSMQMTESWQNKPHSEEKNLTVEVSVVLWAFKLYLIFTVALLDGGLASWGTP